MKIHERTHNLQQKLAAMEASDYAHRKALLRLAESLEEENHYLHNALERVLDYAQREQHVSREQIAEYAKRALDLCAHMRETLNPA
jgi:uncharacterized membrane protein